MNAAWTVCSSSSVETKKAESNSAKKFLCAAAEGCFSAPLPDVFAFYPDPSALYRALHGAAVAGDDGYAYLGNTGDGKFALFVRLAAGIDGSPFIGIQKTELIHCGARISLPGEVIKEMYLDPDGGLYEAVARVRAFRLRKHADPTSGAK